MYILVLVHDLHADNNNSTHQPTDCYDVRHLSTYTGKHKFDATLKISLKGNYNLIIILHTNREVPCLDL